LAKNMKYLSVCSGIEAATVAWHPLGWEALAFSEIEKFPRQVLNHHYPDVPLHGDFTLLRDQSWIADADILVGGTPCQAFSVAGQRNSLDDDRGNLTLEFVRLANAIDDLRPSGRCTIIVWENVPGVLSVKDNAFGCFLGAIVGNDTPLVPTGGKWTNAGMVVGPRRSAVWRILDAQYFGVAQRRRRVFVVASARDGFDPAEVLFEREGLRRNTPPSREPGQEPSATIAARFGISRNNHEDVVATNSHVAGTLAANAGGLTRPAGNANELDFCIAQPIPINSMNALRSVESDKSTGAGVGEGGDAMFTITKGHSYEVAQPVAYASSDGIVRTLDNVMSTLDSAGESRGTNQQRFVHQEMAVRRLTPRECERLQGFPDDYTAIPNGADGPRYKALGNSMAVPVMHWIGKKISKEMQKNDVEVVDSI
jgi:DNA (cytosine-5)-methyltransferase 1